MVSLRRLPQKLQSKSTLSSQTVQIHSLFRHGFIKKPKSRFNRNRRILNLFLRNGFRKTDLGIDLIPNAFRGSIQNTRLFSSFIFCPSFIFSCLPSNEQLKLFVIFIQRMVSLMVILFNTNCLFFVYMYIDLLRLKAYKLFENIDADLSWLLFQRSQLVLGLYFRSRASNKISVEFLWLCTLFTTTTLMQGPNARLTLPN